MDAISYLRIIGGRWRIVVLTCLIGLVAGWVTTPGAGDGAEAFSATHILRAESPGSAREQPQGNRGGQVSSSAGLAAFLVTNGEVPIRAAAELDAEPAELLPRVRADSSPAVGTLSITAVHPDPERAAEIADTFANELLEVLAEEKQAGFSDELEEAEARLAEATARLDELPEGASGRGGGGTPEVEAATQRYLAAAAVVDELKAQGPPSAGFVTLQAATPQPGPPGAAAGGSGARESQSDRRGDEAEADAVPAVGQEVDTAPRRPARMAIGGAVGLLLGIGLALLRERLDARIRTREDAERAFGLPVLAEVPQLDRMQRREPEIATVENGRALEAEAYRVLATSLLFHRSPGAGGDGFGSQNGQRDGHSGALTGSPGRGAGAGDPAGLVETPDDVRWATDGLPVLGRLPVPPPGGHRAPQGLSAAMQATSPAGDAYRALRSHFVRAGSDGPARTLLVAGATPGDATTAMAADLGVALAGDGLRVVVVDGDLRAPRLHELFDMRNTVGFTSVVSGEVSLSAASQTVTGRERLSVVAAGPLPADSHELLSSPRTDEVLAALAGTVDVVVLTVAPVLGATDASALASRVDGTVLVATAGSTSGPDLRAAAEMLRRDGTSLLGVVLHERVRDPHSNGRKATPGTGPAPSEGDVILVTSPGAKEGKSSASSNLATALAEAGKSVVALDFDLRRPRLHEFFGGEPHQSGLSDVLALSGRGPTLEGVLRPTPIPEVRVAFSGSAVTNPSELLPGARRLVTEARHLAEVVLIDTPPVLVASDAVQLIPAADAVIIVCRTGTTRAAEAVRARQLLARLDAPALGLVLVGAHPSSGARSYYYDYHSTRRRHFWSRMRSGPGKARRAGADKGPAAGGGTGRKTGDQANNLAAPSKDGQAPRRAGRGDTKNQAKIRAKKAKQRS